MQQQECTSGDGGRRWCTRRSACAAMPSAAGRHTQRHSRQRQGCAEAQAAAATARPAAGPLQAVCLKAGAGPRTWPRKGYEVFLVGAVGISIICSRLRAAQLLTACDPGGLRSALRMRRPAADCGDAAAAVWRQLLPSVA